MLIFDGSSLIGAKLMIASHEWQRSYRHTARISLGYSMSVGLRSDVDDRY